ncbi:MAG TPA: RHS repeat-associated core domain-containing protein [Candidatus Nanoarchaeia archaeon]|nr:RHS repeat-associated core domain-containing protein [Candidatus Nanoarchaeia archaeon]
MRIREGNSSSGQLLEEYLYHPIEDRVLAKKVYSVGNSPDEYIVYVNDNFIRRTTNLGGAPNTTDSYYVYDEMGIAGEFTVNVSASGERRLFYHTDHLGSTSVITNESGGVIEETFYAPYGDIISGGATSRFDYEGKEFSSATEEYDFHFRKYSPDLLIFTQPDALIPNAYDPQQLNRYAFERRNPYRYTDPSGNVITLPILGAVAAIGFGVGVVSYYAYNYIADKQSTWQGAVGWGVGGAAATTIGVAAPAIFGTSLVVYGGAGMVGGGIAQISANIGEDKSWSEGLLSAMVTGALTAGAGKELLPLERIWLIKNPLSYFTTKTGQTFISNQAIEQFGSMLGTNYFSKLFGNTNQNQQRMDNLINQMRSEGSSDAIFGKGGGSGYIGGLGYVTEKGQVYPTNNPKWKPNPNAPRYSPGKGKRR